MTAGTAPTRYRVTAAYVTIKAEVGGFLSGRGDGYGLVGVYRDGLVPPSADPAAVERLLSRGLIEEVAM